MTRTIGIAFTVLLLLGGAATASARGSAENSFEGTSTIRTCMKAAVATREAALASDLIAFHGAVADAYADRASALDMAWGAGTRADIKKNVATAWKEFKTSVKAAKATWVNEKRTAWATFKTSAKSCKAPSETLDSGNASTEA